jgi:hypothetical protein
MSPSPSASPSTCSWRNCGESKAAPVSKTIGIMQTGSNGFLTNHPLPFAHR